MTDANRSSHCLYGVGHKTNLFVADTDFSAVSYSAFFSAENVIFSCGFSPEVPGPLSSAL